MSNIPTASEIETMREIATKQIEKLSDEVLAGKVCQEVLFFIGQQNYGYYALQQLIIRFNKKIGIKNAT